MCRPNNNWSSREHFETNAELVTLHHFVICCWCTLIVGTLKTLNIILRKLFFLWHYSIHMCFTVFACSCEVTFTYMKVCYCDEDQWSKCFCIFEASQWKVPVFQTSYFHSILFFLFFICLMIVVPAYWYAEM